jgi:uncharacterized protein (DUF427 family)
VQSPLIAGLFIGKATGVLTDRHPLEAHVLHVVSQPSIFEQTSPGSEARIQTKPDDEQGYDLLANLLFLLVGIYLSELPFREAKVARHDRDRKGERQMALTKGTGPFGEQSNGTFNFDTSVLKAHTLYLEDCPKRVRAVFNDETIADSRSVKILHETGHLPVYYFPEEDINQDLLEPSDHLTHCPFKGDASYRSVRVGDRVAENAVWSYPEPLESAPPLAGYAAFYWHKMDISFTDY